ncbi:SH3 domain-binding glutamic acid-rich protein homolog isoform X2 [Photinus pyralis]|uniref:SH3 domain-binding glutamic acid-rich protein homolog isoform X2 n=1 Tax=Photinus pyralis TaxID=7054 RepID=UPI0012676970|nr:SH3 domain-binding glutamic acid-rich protein homolog isoform X2 [Photinus pyralis]
MKVKKRQQRVLMILDSKNIKYEVVDIAEPGNEDPKEFMQNNAKSFGATIGDANPRHPLPPQIFNDEDYCGDYDQFDLSNEIDEIEKFLKLPSVHTDKTIESHAEIKLGNGEITHDPKDTPKEATEEQKSEEPKAEEVKTEDVPVEDNVDEHNSSEAAQGEVNEKNEKESEENKKEVEKNEEPEKNKEEPEVNKEETEKNKEEPEENEEVEKIKEEPEKHEVDNAKVESESKEKSEDGNELSETAAEA